MYHQNPPQENMVIMKQIAADKFSSRTRAFADELSIVAINAIHADNLSKSTSFQEVIQQKLFKLMVSSL